MQTVLIVENDSVDREMVASTLHGFGYDVRSADAWDQELLTDSVKLVVLDVHLGGCEVGAAVASALRAAGVRIPVLLYANSSVQDTDLLVAVSRASACVPKGDPVKLLEAVDRELWSASAHAEA